MTFKANVLLVALLALCLAVSAVNAASLTVSPPYYGGQTVGYNIGNVYPNEVFTISCDNQEILYFTLNSDFSNSVQQSLTITLSGSLGSNYVDVYWIGRPPNRGTFRINYNVVSEPTPEPTSVPVNPYISVTELYSDNLGTVYRFQCMPSSGVLYSNIVPYIIPAYLAPSYAGELISEQTIIEYRVPAGGTSEFSAVYVTAPLTVGVISTTVTAPALTPEQNQTYNPIPDPAQKPLTPFTSGKFQPTLTSGQVDVISKSPYVALLSNLNQSMQLPVMESPDSIRNKLVPDDLENITGPLYDTAAGWAEFTNFVPRLIADTMIGVYSPFLSAIADCKSVLLSFTGQLAELMKPVYILAPLFYLFIPDLVWIGVCLVLVLLIIHALLVFVLGEDTVVYFMGRDTIVADAIPDFPALEK